VVFDDPLLQGVERRLVFLVLAQVLSKSMCLPSAFKTSSYSGVNTPALWREE